LVESEGSMVVPNPPPATLDDLFRYDGKAELIGGRIIPAMPVGRRHNRIAARVYRSLHDYATATGVGEAYTDNMGFAIRPPRPSRPCPAGGCRWTTSSADRRRRPNPHRDPCASRPRSGRASAPVPAHPEQGADAAQDQRGRLGHEGDVQADVVHAELEEVHVI